MINKKGSRPLSEMAIGIAMEELNDSCGIIYTSIGIIPLAKMLTECSKFNIILSFDPELSRGEWYLLNKNGKYFSYGDDKEI